MRLTDGTMTLEDAKRALAEYAPHLTLEKIPEKPTTLRTWFPPKMWTDQAWFNTHVLQPHFMALGEASLRRLDREIALKEIEDEQKAKDRDALAGAIADKMAKNPNPLVPRSASGWLAALIGTVAVKKWAEGLADRAADKRRR